MKLVEDIDCPHCKKPFTKETDLQKLDKVDPIQPTSATISQTQQILKEKPKEPEIKIETVIEDFKPNYECPDGNCDIKVHKNKNYLKRPKGKCSNCDQLTKQEKGQCPWCKKDDTIEEIDEETLSDLGISIPQIVDHTEHNHE